MLLASSCTQNKNDDENINSSSSSMVHSSSSSVAVAAVRGTGATPPGMRTIVCQEEDHRCLLLTDNVQRDSLQQQQLPLLLLRLQPTTSTTTTQQQQKSSLTNSRGQRPAGAVNYVALQRAATATVVVVDESTIPVILGINKRTFKSTHTAFGPEVIPRFICIAAAEVGDLFEDPVEIFYKPWETRMASWVSSTKKTDIEKKEVERLINKQVSACDTMLWFEIDRINRCRSIITTLSLGGGPTTMLARSAAMHWMRMFYEVELDAILLQ